MVFGNNKLKKCEQAKSDQSSRIERLVAQVNNLSKENSLLKKENILLKKNVEEEIRKTNEFTDKITKHVKAKTEGLRVEFAKALKDCNTKFVKKSPKDTKKSIFS